MMVFPSPAGDCEIFCVTVSPAPFSPERRVVAEAPLLSSELPVRRASQRYPAQSPDRCGNLHDCPSFICFMVSKTT
jgi:hypothetical protein